MFEAIDMSLDEIIKNNKKSSKPFTNSNFRPHGRSRGRDFEHGPGPTRRFDNRDSTRSKPYYVPQDFSVENMVVGGEDNAETETKLYISNLDYDVSNEDIKVLFSDVGELKRYSIHYDRAGRSKGTAEVVYMRQSDAVAAMKRYNNLQLDGKPMKLELVGVNIVTPVPVPVPSMQKGTLGSNPFNPSRGNQGRIAGRGQVRGGNKNNAYHRGSEKGHGGGRNRPEQLTADDLDADLESYRLQAIRIN